MANYKYLIEVTFRDFLRDGLKFPGRSNFVSIDALSTFLSLIPPEKIVSLKIRPVLMSYNNESSNVK